MNYQRFITILSTDLGAWAREVGGEFVVADNPLQPYVLLSGGLRNTFLVILELSGSTPLNAQDHPHGFRNVRAGVYIGHPLDLRSERDAWLYRDDADRKSLLTMLDLLCARLFTISFSNGANADDAYCHNVGLDQVTLPNGIPLRAFRQSVEWPLRIDVNETQYRKYE